MSRGYTRVTVDIDICHEQPPMQSCTRRVHVETERQVLSPLYGVSEQRQSSWTDDNHSGRSVGTMISYPGRCQIDLGPTGPPRRTEAELAG